MVQINVSPRFKRAYKKLPRHIKDSFQKRIKVFAKDPWHPSLKTHKLQGVYQECLSFRLDDGYRVLFEFSSANAADLLDIGPHDLYRKRR